MKNGKWKTQYDRERVRSNVGSREHILYGGVYDEKGRLKLEEKGVENIYDYIQSFKDSVDIHVILKRFENGDTDVLKRVQGFYGDFSGLNVDYATLLNVVQQGENMFMDMPVEVRAKFGHDFNTFMTALSNGTICEIMGVNTDPSPVSINPSPASADPSPAVE